MQTRHDAILIGGRPQGIVSLLEEKKHCHEKVRSRVWSLVQHRVGILANVILELV